MCDLIHSKEWNKLKNGAIDGNKKYIGRKNYHLFYSLKQRKQEAI
jgi:hypothetical protein